MKWLHDALVEEVASKSDPEAAEGAGGPQGASGIDLQELQKGRKQGHDVGEVLLSAQRGERVGPGHDDASCGRLGRRGRGEERGGWLPHLAEEESALDGAVAGDKGGFAHGRLPARGRRRGG